ncbi:hypothetical protein NHX12_017134 [Muraenolepis orangiensis]|uniref:Uncharacterized protein n=1 Tax=Muraenolepis orangiensis TaxID=630683 RepID=A0A9Q0D7Q7_9TELE|nr:hypothetical protein NHX12_017134 [Muraenolepis orangiensis]
MGTEKRMTRWQEDLEKTTLSTGKTVSAAYHLCNGEAKRELSVSVDNKRLEHQLAPKYLGVRLDRTLSYKRHLEEVRAKVTARVSLIRRLAGTTWGASARTLRISTQALVFSAAEYCAPVWSRSPHVKKAQDTVSFMSGFFAEVLGDFFPTPPVLDRAHRMGPASADKERHRPRVFMVCFHYHRDKQRVARETGGNNFIYFRGHKVFIFQDHSANTAHKRSAFNTVKAKLHKRKVTPEQAQTFYHHHFT